MAGWRQRRPERTRTPDRRSRSWHGQQGGSRRRHPGSTRQMIRAALAAALFAASSAGTAAPALYGVHEHVELSGLGLHLPAKLDTGAQTASLSATGIELFKRDGQRWVRFRLTDNIDEHGHLIEKPLARMGYIKR